ncbi:MAG: diacylglycerol kinase family protein [Chthoniobacterales bacterium]
MIVILNRSAGGRTGSGLEAELTELFRANGVDASILHAGEGVDLHRLLGENQVGPDAIVVAGGGDGTVRAVAAELVGTGRTLGVLPLGTLNHFAKDLGIPLDLEGAVRTVVAGRVSEIDVAEVNGRVFVNNSGLGLYPQIVAEREAEQKRHGSGKWPAFARAAFNAVRRHPFLHLRVCLDGEERQFKTASVFVGNNPYEITGLNLGTRECLNAGKLGFYLANRTGRFGLLRLAVSALLGRLHRAEDFVAFCIEEARIESRKHSLLVSTDGEVTRMTTPLQYRIRPGALRVLVPAEKGAT